jgi:hypothetical protein
LDFSLFLLHLSTESQVIFDRSGFLGQLFDNFEPKSSYVEDFSKSLDLITPLDTSVINAPNACHRLAYTYSLFRVFGVYLLAERGIYEFSKSRMTASLVEHFPKVSREIKELADLRVLNANFFGGSEMAAELQSRGSMVDLQTVAEALGRLVNRSVIPRILPYEDAVAQFESSARGQSRGLEYRHRAWFLLLLYDGLNLFCRSSGNSPLQSFSGRELTKFTSPEFPAPVNFAAAVALEYLQNYPLRYFLFKENRIQTQDALSSLRSLSKVV